MSGWSDRALELLRVGCSNPAAEFRDGQFEALRHVLQSRGRLLLVQKTGWGKSFVYFITIKLLREAGFGPALLVSPLLALMRNQIAAAERMGVTALTINSDNQDDWESVEQAILGGGADIVLISPERLSNQRFRSRVMADLMARLSLLVIDEAHCISDWGHDFRPHYRLIGRIARDLPPGLRLLATTATANDRVVEDLQEVLGPGLTVSRGDLARPSLLLQTIRLAGQAERLAWLADQVPRLPGHGIVYTLTVRDAEQVAEWLRSRGLNVASYTSETGETRPELEQALLENRVKALVATTALGMGFDKPDLAFVIHYQAPGSVVAYYQQVGRAGRALDAAYAVLLSGTEETEITGYFIDTAFPTQEDVQAILQLLRAAPDGLTVNDLMARVNMRKGRIDRALLMLSLESPSPVAKDGAKWRLASAELSEEFWERAERLTRLRREEQRQMQEYVRLTAGHMEFLIQALDGDAGEIQPPPLAPLQSTAPAQLVTEAAEFLRGGCLSFEPRRMWPPGGLPAYGVRGKIPAGAVAQPGRALCAWGDAGWGEEVRRGKYRDRRLSDELVETCVKLLAEWRPDPLPAWVTCIPSLRQRRLLPDYAERLANALGLPFVTALERKSDRPAQKSMSNSVQQAMNLDGAFAVRADSLPRGAVLLVDDLVDSGWTFTVAAWLLSTHGSGPVYPMALAMAAGRS